MTTTPRPLPPTLIPSEPAGRDEDGCFVLARDAYFACPACGVDVDYGCACGDCGKCDGCGDVFPLAEMIAVTCDDEHVIECRGCNARINARLATVSLRGAA